MGERTKLRVLWDSVSKQLASQLLGIEPSARLCAGEGFSREKIKAELLATGQGLRREAVTSLEALAWERLQLPAEPLLDSWTSAILFAEALDDPQTAEIANAVPVLRNRLKEPAWRRKIGRTLIQAREAFAHFEELRVWVERLESASQAPLTPMFEQWVIAVTYWEAWLAQVQLWDRPRLLLEAARAEVRTSQAQTIWRLDLRERVESREQALWDVLGARHLALPEDRLTAWNPWNLGDVQAQVRIHVAHTWDDVADIWADQVVEAAGSGHFNDHFNGQALVIPDAPALRRTLYRALRRRGIPLYDDRDPTALRMDERIKAALGEMRRTVRTALTLEAFGENLQTRVGDGYRLLEPLMQRWTTQWLKWGERVPQLVRPRPASTWVQWLEEQIERAAPVESRRNTSGGQEIFRQSTVSLRNWPQMSLMGLQPLEPISGRDLMWKDRYRSRLATEFAIDDPMSKLRHQQRLLRAWLQSVDAGGVIQIWTCEESVAAGSDPAQVALQCLASLGAPAEKKDDVSDQVLCEVVRHQVWAPRALSYQPDSWALAEIGAEVRLPPGPGPAPWSVSQVERYSRCPFIALAQDRWKLEDARLQSIELPPSDRGKILHRVVEIAARACDAIVTGDDARRCVETAWAEVPRDPAWQETPAMCEALLTQWTHVLQVFLEKEKAYRSQTGAVPRGFEERFTWVEPRTQTQIRGVLDRYDVLPDGRGIVVMDYKTGGDVPSGRTMVENGYRLQLGVTALALQSQLQTPVVAAHFVKLDRTGHRTRGVFFEPWVDRRWIAHATTRKQNIFKEDERADAWDQMHARLEEQLRSRSQGIFDALPRLAQECAACGWREVCLQGRRERVAIA